MFAKKSDNPHIVRMCNNFQKVINFLSSYFFTIYVSQSYPYPVSVSARRTKSSTLSHPSVRLEMSRITQFDLPVFNFLNPPKYLFDTHGALVVSDYLRLYSAFGLRDVIKFEKSMFHGGNKSRNVVLGTICIMNTCYNSVKNKSVY